MEWHDIPDPDHKRLDEMAARYSLYPLHVEDCRQNAQPIAADRDRLAGVLDIYLSSVVNRTTEATKTLTLLGTAALPALVITGIFGMNIEYPSCLSSSPYSRLPSRYFSFGA
jgi:Mg2+ and Co2+ transporter CorA